MTDATRRARLPGWARQELTVLEHQVNSLRSEVRRLHEASELAPGDREVTRNVLTPLDPTKTVRFVHADDPERYVDVYWDLAHRSLVVMASRFLRLSPQSGNVVRVRVVDEPF